MNALVAMRDGGFIIGSYVITAAVIAALAATFVRNGRRAAERVDDADKYWT